MKFINAKFFYNSSELIGEYSYWWFLMGIPVNVIAKDELTSEFNILKEAQKSYTINNSTSVILNNAYICGMLKAKTPEIPQNIITDTSNKGQIVLIARSSDENSIIPFSVGQDHKEDGHRIDSLWLVRLKKEVAGQDEILNYFPFTRDGDSTATTHIYTGIKSGYDIQEGNEVLIGYSVSSSNNEVVNAMNFSGFTVGDSTITISGLVDESVK